MCWRCLPQAPYELCNKTPLVLHANACGCQRCAMSCVQNKPLHAWHEDRSLLSHPPDIVMQLQVASVRPYSVTSVCRYMWLPMFVEDRLPSTNPLKSGIQGDLMNMKTFVGNPEPPVTVEVHWHEQWQLSDLLSGSISSQQAKR